MWLIVPAAGRSTRSGLAINKAYAPIGGVCPLVRSIAAFAGIAKGVVVAVGETDAPLFADIEPILSAIMPTIKVIGGATRAESVANALKLVPSSAEYVAVHDAARPFVSRDVIMRCLTAAKKTGAAIPTVGVIDTLVSIEGDKVIDRDAVRAVQTPQVFEAKLLREAYAAIGDISEAITDDASVVRAYGATVAMVDGDSANIKLTRPNDFVYAEALSRSAGDIRVGFGMDAHRFEAGRRLVLCGVDVPHDKGLLGHSDADAPTHALIDALLGAVGRGDIGRWFPDTNAKYKGICSIDLLREVVAALAADGDTVMNVDVTIAAQKPKLAPHIDEMKRVVAQAVLCGNIGIKATTTERMGFTGREEGIAAFAVCCVRVGGR